MYIRVSLASVWDVTNLAGQSEMLAMGGTELANCLVQAVSDPDPKARKNFAYLLSYSDGDEYPYWKMLEMANNAQAHNAAAKIVSETLCADSGKPYYGDYAYAVTKAVTDRFKNGKLYANEARNYYEGCQDCGYSPFRNLCAEIGTYYNYAEKYYNESAMATHT